MATPMTQYHYAPLPRDLCNRRWGMEESGDGKRRIIWGDHTKTVYQALGLRGNSIPKNMKGKFNVDGHTVVVFPSSSQGGRGRNYKKKHISGRKYGLSRVFFLLPNKKLVPVGRIAQSKYCGGTGGRRRRP